MTKKYGWFTCLENTEEFPEAIKGKTYYGEYDEDGDIWLLDEFWLKEISINEFDLMEHGAYIEIRNKNKFKLLEDK